MTFRLERPRGARRPLVVEVPHAGVGLPDEVRPTLDVAMGDVRRDADSYVDDLYRDAPSHGASLLVASVSRYVVDLNRDESDVDDGSVLGAGGGDFPRGVVWRETGEGRVALRRSLTRAEFEDRLERYYRPYHRALAAEVASLRARHPHVLLVAAHSMPSMGRGPRGDQRLRRADVVPGTRGRTTAARVLIDAVESHFRAAGLSVRHDDPYRGGATTGRWGRPDEGIHAVQIELNRALYMDEHTGDPRPDGVAWITTLCGTLLERLGEVIEGLR